MARNSANTLREFVVARVEPTGRANARPMINSAKSGAGPLVGSRIALCFIRATAAEARSIGWVERSDTHQLQVGEDDGFREGLNPSYRTDLPVGRIVDRAVESLLQKYFASPVGQIISTNSRHPTPPEGRIMIVRNAGWNAVDAAAFCARWDRRAGRKTCERSIARGRGTIAADGKIVWS